MKIEGTILASAGSSRRSAVLLRAVNPIRKLIVRSHVIELPSRLVVPTAPCFAAIARNHRALIVPQDHPLRLVRIDPQFVIVVAAWFAPEPTERFPAGAPAIQPRIR